MTYKEFKNSDFYLLSDFGWCPYYEGNTLDDLIHYDVKNNVYTTNKGYTLTNEEINACLVDSIKSNPVGCESPAVILIKKRNY